MYARHSWSETCVLFSHDCFLHRGRQKGSVGVASHFSLSVQEIGPFHRLRHRWQKKNLWAFLKVHLLTFSLYSVWKFYNLFIKFLTWMSYCKSFGSLFKQSHLRNKKDDSTLGVISTYLIIVIWEMCFAAWLTSPDSSMSFPISKK